MALIKLGVGIAAISGKVGGSVFKNSLGGVTLQQLARRKWGKQGVINPQQRALNPNNLLIMDAVIYCARYWKSLTIVQKAAWVAAAPNFPTVNKLGIPNKPSGYHCFLHINIRQYYMNAVILLDPPANTVGVVPCPFTITSCTLSTVTMNISVAIPVGYMAYVKSMVSISAGIKPSPSSFRIINYLAAGATGSINNITQYQNSFGKPIVGNTLWLSLVLSNLTTGELGAPYVVASVVS